MAKEKLINNPWIVGCGLIALTPFITGILDYFNKLPVFSTLIICYNSCIQFLNIEVKIWQILTSIITLIILVYIIKSRTISKETKKFGMTVSSTESSLHNNYTEAKFKKWKWTWDWVLENNIRIINNLNAHCPICDTILMENFYLRDIEYSCPRCNYSAQSDQADDRDQIEHLILDEVKRKGGKVNFK